MKSQCAGRERRHQRRLDLIPNLVRTVQGAANFEKSTLEAVVTRARGWGRWSWPGALPARRADPTVNFQAFSQFGTGSGRPQRRPVTPARRRRALPGAEGEPELPRAAVTARRNREPDRRRAPPLQRSGADLQRRRPALSRQHRGRNDGIPAEAVLQGDRGSRAAPAVNFDFGTTQRRRRRNRTLGTITIFDGRA